MFILRMIFRSFSRQFRRRLLVAITICLSSAVATAMLGVVFDVGDKLNEELSAYGSNIVIEPKSDAVVADLYETVDGSDTEPTSFLKESDIQKIKTIFWAYNITNFAPKLNLHADITAGTGGDAATVPASAPGSTPHCIWPPGKPRSSAYKACARGGPSTDAGRGTTPTRR